MVEIINTKAKDKPSKLFQDFNASVQFIPNPDNGQSSEKKLLQVEFPQHSHSIEDINKVKLRSFNHLPEVLLGQTIHFKLMTAILRTIIFIALSGLNHPQTILTAIKTQ